jgi:hypothetical protein
MTANKNSLGNNDSGVGSAQSLDIPQNPLDFLKLYVGKRKTIKAKGIFIDDLLTKRGRLIRSEYFIGYISGRYKVIFAFGELILRASYHALAVRQLDWIEINGVKVRGGEND